MKTARLPACRQTHRAKQRHTAAGGKPAAPAAANAEPRPGCVYPRPLVYSEPSRRAAARGGVPRPFRLHGGCRFFDRAFFFQPWALGIGGAQKWTRPFPRRPASLTLSSAASTCQRRRGITPETDAGRYNKKGISVPSLCSCTGGAGCLFSRFSFLHGLWKCV